MNHLNIINSKDVSYEKEQVNIVSKFK